MDQTKVGAGTSAVGVHTGLPQNGHHAVQFQLEILHQLEDGCGVQAAMSTLGSQARSSFVINEGGELYLPHSVELGSLWHRVLPRLVQQNLVMIDGFAVHDRKGKAPRFFSLSHSEWQ